MAYHAIQELIGVLLILSFIFLVVGVLVVISLFAINKRLRENNRLLKKQLEPQGQEEAEE